MLAECIPDTIRALDYLAFGRLSESTLYKASQYGCRAEHHNAVIFGDDLICELANAFYMLLSVTIVCASTDMFTRFREIEGFFCDSELWQLNISVRFRIPNLVWYACLHELHQWPMVLK